MAKFRAAARTEAQKRQAEMLAAVANITNTDTDVVLYSGYILHQGLWMLDRLLSSMGKRRSNILLFLTTAGGSADDAYRIGRCIQHYYQNGRFIVLVGSYCKSAGTLLTLAANEIHMTNVAELGPMDVQILKKDEIGERTSGLTPIQALSTLQVQANETFTDHFMQLTETLGSHLSTNTITQMASKLTVECFSRIYEHVDPMRLAEFHRFVKIAGDYGARLSQGRLNVRPGAVDSLINDYPSHEFVIDRREACKLFFNVAEASEDELRIVLATQSKVMAAFTDTRPERPLIEVLSMPRRHAKSPGRPGGTHDRRSAHSGGSAAQTKDGKGADAESGTGAKDRTTSKDSGMALPVPDRDSRMRRSSNGRKRR